MDLSRWKHLNFFGFHFGSFPCKCLALFTVAVILRGFWLPVFSGFSATQDSAYPGFQEYLRSPIIRSEKERPKFLEVPQIIWGLNNQKIAFARACLTARMLNRTLLMPSFSASLFYKEVDLLQPISFDKVFQFEKFNSLCQGFIKLGYYSDISNQSDVVELQKGSGRRWTIKKDMDQLREFSKYPYDRYQLIRVTGKNPFLWHDHWPVQDYAKIFECLTFVEEILNEADKVVSKIRETGRKAIRRAGSSEKSSSPEGILSNSVPYMAVHMRIEKDWMIHCKKLEQRSNISEICSNKGEILERVGNILGLSLPMPVYLAVADSLLEDNSILTGWKKGFVPLEKKKLEVVEIYQKHPYLIQSAIDYEVCSRSNVFVGNSFSTFSSLVVLDRTQREMKMGQSTLCGVDVRWPSYAYNLLGEFNGPRRWVTNMSDVSLQAISYGSNRISC